MPPAWAPTDAASLGITRSGWQVDEAVRSALERGTSMLTEALIPKGTSAAMEKLRSNPAAWNETMESFAQLNKFTDFVNEIGDRYDTAHETLDWMAVKRTCTRTWIFSPITLGH